MNQKPIEPRAADLLNNCEICKGTGLRSAMVKRRGRFRPTVVICYCKVKKPDPQ